MPTQQWEIVGGGDAGGVIVRKGKVLGSAKLEGRLTTGSIVNEIELHEDRLHYELAKGDGPKKGWISVTLPGKKVAIRIEPAKKPEPEEPVKKAPPPRPPSPEPPYDPNKAPPLVVNSECEPPGAREARIERSRETLRKRAAGEKMLPEGLKFPARLDPYCLGHMQPWQRMSKKDLYEKCKTNLPGMFSGMTFPWTAQQLREFGAPWLTEAFHKFKTLPEDNRVSKLVKVREVPLSGFDCCGGSGPKAFVTVEYEKPDPNLHTELFAKMPWDPHGSYPGVPASTPETYRFFCSGQAENEALEVQCSALMETLFPFPMPKCYFTDINRENTNYLLLCERIAFGRRGKVVDGKVVEKIEREPYDILPVCGKYQDFLLDDPRAIYFQLMRTMASLAAWDHLGRFDLILGPMNKYTPEQYEAASLPRKPCKKARMEGQQRGCMLMVEPAIKFASTTAPWFFSKKAISKANLDKLKSDLWKAAPYFEDIKAYVGNTSDFQGVQHGNLQSDNAYFWRDENGELDCGVFDFGGLGRGPSYVGNFMGCLSGADAPLLLENEESFMKTFAETFHRYGGPQVDVEELLMRWRLFWLMCASDTCSWIERDALREIPEAEWKSIKSRHDPKFMDTWNARCRTTTFISCLEYWPNRDLGKIFDEWKEGKGKAYLTPVKPE